jgi:hypothetical protein
MPRFVLRFTAGRSEYLANGIGGYGQFAGSMSCAMQQTIDSSFSKPARLAQTACRSQRHSNDRTNTKLIRAHAACFWNRLRSRMITSRQIRPLTVNSRKMTPEIAALIKASAQ